MIGRRTPARTRLPGFRFTVQPPPLPEVLPRMDVAGFRALRRRATLLSRGLVGPLNEPAWHMPGRLSIDLALVGPDDVRPGDLLRMSFGDDLTLLLTVQSVGLPDSESSPPVARTRGTVTT